PSISFVKWRGWPVSALCRFPTLATGSTVFPSWPAACPSPAKCPTSGTIRPTFICARYVTSRGWLHRWICASPTWLPSAMGARFAFCPAGAAPWRSIILLRLILQGPDHFYTRWRLSQSTRSPFAGAGFFQWAAACTDQWNAAGLGHGRRRVVTEHRVSDAGGLCLHAQVFMGTAG